MKILGLDLGTNSIGAAIRNDDLDQNQIEWMGVTIFNKGVGDGKAGEFSYAAERTKNRSVRRLYQARKYRLWATLEILIKNDFCPFKLEELDRWRKYNKSKALNGEGGREYLLTNEFFNNWIKLDFNNDGIQDYTSPYQLRKDLIENVLDLTNQINRYKIGRALYHIAQRRGFKSSRKDKKETDNKENENDQLKRSETKKELTFEKHLIEKYSITLTELKTVGAALA